MQTIADLPPFAIDQIIGHRDTSYVVIKLWLCGFRKLHSKLSEGLTFLELRGHPAGVPANIVAYPSPSSSIIFDLFVVSRLQAKW